MARRRFWELLLFLGLCHFLGSGCVKDSPEKPLPPALGKLNELTIVMDTIWWQGKIGSEVRARFSASRKFQFSVPNLRYGSGVRFELSNSPKSKKQDWSFKFYHGNSKNIKEIPLNGEVKNALAPIVNTSRNTVFNDHIDQLSETYKDYHSGKLQELWTSAHSDNEVFNFLDHVGTCVRDILNQAELSDIEPSVVEAIVNEKNRKLEENKDSLLVGFYFLSSLNNKIFNQ